MNSHITLSQITDKLRCKSPLIFPYIIKNSQYIIDCNISDYSLYISEDSYDSMVNELQEELYDLWVCYVGDIGAWNLHNQTTEIHDWLIKHIEEDYNETV